MEPSTLSIEKKWRRLPLLWTCCLCLAALMNARAAVPQQSQSVQNAPQAESKATASQPQPENLSVSKVFHVAGIPKVSRIVRGDLSFTESEMIFRRGKRELLRIPF